MNSVEDITLLDCTLRDGGHLTSGIFGEKMIKNTIKNLVDANIDIIEIGFLMESSFDVDTAKYRTIEEVKRVLPSHKGNSKFSLMADFIDISDLEKNDGTIDYIRLSFKRQRIEWALNAAKTLMNKGYKCFLNPVNCNVYSDEEYMALIKRINSLKPYGFSIVDTFGVLRKQDLMRLYLLVENNLDQDICVGVHLHDNLGLAFVLAQCITEIRNPKRKICIDGSLLGMGRAPGNLCIEQMMNYMNEQYGRGYKLEPALDIIDDYIEPLKDEKKWGYSIPYYLSAKYKVHRTYGEYLMNKWKLGTKDIQRILSQISHDEAEYFNESYIENLYQDYINVSIDDKDYMYELQNDLKNKEIMIIVPGSTIKTYKDKIIYAAKKKNRCIISVGFIPDFLKVDYVWYTSVKRYRETGLDSNNVKRIITSNLLHDADKYEFVVNYHTVLYHGGSPNDNSMLMLINLLKSFGIRQIDVAGFDGFDELRQNYYGGLLNRDKTITNINEQISNILSNCYNQIQLNFLTPTLYLIS